MTSQHPTQQGMALIEALIASAILGIGLVGATQLSLATLGTANQNRQHTLAQQLAQEAMDCLRDQAVRALRALETPCIGEDNVQLQGITYKRQSQSKPGGTGEVTHLQVRVTVTGSAPSPSGTKASGLGHLSHAPWIEWHSSVSTLPTWVGVSLP